MTNRTCGECGREAIARRFRHGRCNACHMRARRAEGVVFPRPRQPKLTPEQRIDRQIVVLPNGCWLWTGHRNKSGYGRSLINGRREFVHRFQYERYKSPIPPGLHIDHLCREEICVNPQHLEAVTPTENTRRAPFNATSINRRKTHCPKGHPYTPDNIYWQPRGGDVVSRLCRACVLEWSRQRYAARKAAA